MKMKKISMLLPVLYLISGITSAQNKNPEKVDYLLNAIDISSKIYGTLLVPEKIVKDENGNIETVHFLMLSMPQGHGIDNTVLCGIDILKPSSFFYNVNYPKEPIFLSNRTWSATGLTKFSFNRSNFSIKKYDQNKRIINIRSAIYKMANKTYQEKAYTITYAPNGKDLSLDETSIFSKGKDIRNRKEKKRMPSKKFNYKEYQDGETKIYELESYEISTSKANKGQKTAFHHDKYSYTREGKHMTIVKEKYSSNGEPKEKSTYRYYNYSLINSATYDENNILIDSVHCIYNEQGFPTSKELYRFKSGNLIPYSSYEYFYKQNDGIQEGKFPIKQWEIRTSYNNEGKPVMQQKNETRLMRRHFENGKWGPWNGLRY